MNYTIKKGRCLSHHGAVHGVSVSPTITDAGTEGIGIGLDVAGLDDLRIEVKPSDFDDEASCSQLSRLAESLQRMVKEAQSRRAERQQRMSCLHLKTERGKDAQRAWGSWRTQVCLDCGAFHLHGHDEDPSAPPAWRKSAWRAETEYEDATAEPADG